MRAGAAVPKCFRVPPFLPTLVVLALLCCCCCFVDLRSNAQSLLPPQEIEALRKIDAKLKVGWNFSVDPCSRSGGWIAHTSDEITRNVTFECNVTAGICHVTRILLKRQNLTGELPPDFAGLTYLQEINLAFNLVSGTFPTEWASLPLVDLILVGNRISGCIPDEIRNITTLESLVLFVRRSNSQLSWKIDQFKESATFFQCF